MAADVAPAAPAVPATLEPQTAAARLSIFTGNMAAGMEAEDPLPTHAHAKLSWPAFLSLSWSSFGVIFGDIATSPLYVYVSVFQDLGNEGAPGKADVLGAASLVIWTLSLIVLVKYIGVVLCADDQGQGGTFALYSLLCRNMGIKPHGTRGSQVQRAAAEADGAITAAGDGHDDDAQGGGGGEGGGGQRDGGGGQATTKAGGRPTSAKPFQRGHCDSDSEGGGGFSDGFGGGSLQRARPWMHRWSVDKRVVHAWFRRSRRAQVALWGVSVVATAMLVGDGVLTPAISVLSAVSGLRVAVPSLSQEVVVVVTIGVLAAVFTLQQIGTGQVGRAFAPIIALWLAANAAINVFNIARHGAVVFEALNPTHILRFFARHGVTAWRSLGAVMLCVTGAEALFADLGHFSRGSISAAFGLLAYPCLMVTYLGQAAHVIAHPEETDAFWASVPPKLLYPMLVLATLATVVASQALISGVFSIIRQAMILGAFPTVRVVHTGGKNLAAATQVYVPLANAMLFGLCVIVVAGFRDTVALGKAYGLAVMTDMMTTTCLVTLVMLAVWEVSLLLVAPFFVLFLVVEGAYWSANIIKIPEGGWFTLAVALGVSLLMLTWWAGSRRLGERLAAIAAGAHIRMLNQPQPPPLLHKPPLPRPPRPPGPGSRSGPAAGGFLSRPSSLALLTQLSRLSGLLLLQRQGSAINQGANSRGTQQRRQRQQHEGLGSDQIAVSSAPLPYDDAAAATSAAVVAGCPPLPPAEPPETQMTQQLQPPSRAGPRVRQMPAAGPDALMAHTGHVQPFAYAAGDHGGPWTGARDWLGGGRRRPVLPESAFPPGTLALVLPANSPLVDTRDGEGAGGWGVQEYAAARQPPPGGDVEAGSPATLQLNMSRVPGPSPPPAVIIPLTVRLPGIGVYYMDEKVGGGNGGLTTLPPVLVHFMRNVHAIHKVCIFLSVRLLPTPTVVRRQRLHIYAPHAATPPNFYQVVSRYGYLDIVDHGTGFISEVLDAILKKLTAMAEAAATTAIPPSLAAATANDWTHGGGRGGGYGPINDTSMAAVRGSSVSMMHPSSNTSASTDESVVGEGAEREKGGSPQLARRGQHRTAVTQLSPSRGTSTRPSVRGGAAAASAVPLQMGETGPDIGGCSISADTTAEGVAGGAGGVPMEVSAAMVVWEDGGVGDVVGATESAATRPPLAGPEARPCIEEVVAAFLDARLHGVVYYASRALIRVTPRTTASPPERLLQWLVYGLTYRWLAAVSYEDMERWRVPPHQLVELGMAVDLIR